MNESGCGRLLLGVALGMLMLVIGQTGRSAAPPVPSGKLTQAQQKQLRQMKARVRELAEAGNMAEAVRQASEIQRLRREWQGAMHWEAVDAQFDVERWRRLARLTKAHQEKAGQAIRLERVGLELSGRLEYVKAQAVLKEALTIRRTILGEEHPETALGYLILAGNRVAQGNYTEAQSICEKVLAIRHKILGEEHPDTALSYSHLAIIKDRQGKHPQAQPLFERALAIDLKVLGVEHPDTAAAFHDLARNLHSQGKYAQALPLFEKAVTIYRKVLGEENPNTVTCYSNLAFNLNEQGKYAQAEPLFKKALAIRLKVLGENPKTAVSYRYLAVNLDRQGKHAQAQTLFEKVLAMNRKLLGEQHPSTIASYGNLAVNLCVQGKHAEGEPLLEKALTMTRNRLGEEHPDTATFYSSMGLNLYNQGKCAQAAPLLEKAVTIFRKVFGEEHPKTAESYLNLAANLKEQGKYVEAQSLCEKALAINRRFLGEEHPNTGTCYEYIADCLELQGKHLQARPLFEKALAINRKILGESHWHTARSHMHVAFNLHWLGKYAQAESQFDEALTIRRKLGVEHPDTAGVYCRMGINLYSQHKYAQAQPLFEMALELDRKCLGEEHPTTGCSYIWVAINLWHQGRVNEAIRLLQASLSGQTIARFQGAPSGFDRVIASRLESPHALLAVGLAQRKQPHNAFRHAEASLSRGLLDDLTAAKTTTDTSQFRSLHARRDDLDRQLVSLFGHTKLSAEQKNLREELIRQRRQVISKLARMAAAVSERQLLPLDEIQKHISDDAALVVWIDIDWLGEHHACIVRAKGDPTWLPARGSETDGAWTAQDRDLAEDLYSLLKQPNTNEGERGRLIEALRKQRLDPLRLYLGAANGLPAVRRLLVVPTGWAGRVPLETLVSDYLISYVPSGSFYARLRQKHRAVEATSLLALGDPVFTTPRHRRPEPPVHGLLLKYVSPGGSIGRAGLRGGDVVLRMGDTPITSLDDLKKTLAGGSGVIRFWRDGEEKSVKLPAGPLGVRFDDRPAPQAVAAWREAESSVVQRGPAPIPLPGTRWEVQALARLVPKATTLLGSEASEQRLDEMARKDQLKTYRLIHLATHALVDWQTPGHSRLLLARDRLIDSVKLVEIGQKVFTGELTVDAIRTDWHLDADLVVLSACKTAVGKDGRGDGPLGFAHALLQRGARSVVLSRWEADDTATALLMLRFYENVLGKRAGLKTPLARAEALAEAKKWLRELTRKETLHLVAALGAGKWSSTTRGSIVDLDLDRTRVKVPGGERPYAHPFFWAAFTLIGDPD